MLTNEIHVSSFYRFAKVAPDAIEQTKALLEDTGKSLALRGLLILAEEGVNGTVAGDQSALDEFELALPEIFDTPEWDFKRSRCGKAPFKGFRVKIRPEIVTSGNSDIVVNGTAQKLSPTDWHRAISSIDPTEAVLLDTRNAYETRLGMFRGAVDPQIANFQDFETYVRNSEIPKDKTVYMYCTGGIRCEKASVQMEQLGYRNVFQLDGGILRYLEEFPNQQFDGDCFVFDGRVAVDQKLHAATHWVFCPHCGDPAKTEIACSFCGTGAKICESCSEVEKRKTCSKNCAHRFEHYPSQKRIS